MTRADAVGRHPKMYREQVAYWFFRLNGCLTITNFVVHPDGRGSQRTEADILAVRFPHRTELKDAERPMVDHWALERTDKTHLIIAEVTAVTCKLNGPWTDPEAGNMHRVLRAIGAFPEEQVTVVAASIYKHGFYEDNDYAVRLLAVGREISTGLPDKVIQLTWPDVLGFIHDRLRGYRRPKRQHEQWDATGQRLYNRATSVERETFIIQMLEEIGVAALAPPRVETDYSEGNAPNI